MAKDTPQFPYSLPLPTYEQAISSRPHSSQSYRGPGEISDDAERQGLLGRADAGQEVTSQTQADYVAPTVESQRSSYDSTYTSPELTPSEDEEADLHRDFEHLEVLEPDTQAERRAQQRGRMRQRFTKHFANLTHKLSSLHLPSFACRFIPSFGFITDHLPHLSNQFKPSWPIIARLFGLFILVSAVYALVVLRAFPSGQDFGTGFAYTPESIRQFVQEHVSPANIQHYLQELTKDDHVAGTKGDIYLAEWVRERFLAAGLDEVEQELYHVYLNYPQRNGRRVAIVDPPELAWEAKLEEDKTVAHGGQHQTLVFHGHSRSGNVTGPLLYANYGSKEDFAHLEQLGIDLSGSIVLVRYYGTQGDRAVKVKAAELAGAAGCLIYSDPADDGFVKGEPWPRGPWRTSDSVQRGAVSLMSWIVGDVLTPGWASTEDAQRISKDNNAGLVNIPSLPLAWRDAQVLLQSLKDHGQRVPDDWRGGVPEVNGWWTGHIESSPTVHLKNLQDEVEKQPIENVIGRIHGYESPTKVIYVGNHRDAWCFGATDPGSGTAVLLEVVHVFGELIKLGWRPRRTIVFASWDAEEYNLIGSTEHVEDRLDDLRADGVAYLNVDVGIAGESFWAAASPVLSLAVLRVLNRVTDPKTNTSLRHLWDERGAVIEGLGAGSDYVAFQSLAGMSSIDFGFRNPDNKHAYPYHSCYDSFDFVRGMLDPAFAYHGTLAQVWALLLFELSDEPFLPFDLIAYSRETERYVNNLEHDLDAAWSSQPASRRNEEDTSSPANNPSKPDLHALRAAAALFVQNANEFDRWHDNWDSQALAADMLEDHNLVVERVLANQRMTDFETNLLDLPQEDEQRVGGVPGREQFKHVLFGPQRWSGYDEAFFPHIRDALEDRDWDGVRKQVDLVARVLHHAADKLLN